MAPANDESSTSAAGKARKWDRIAEAWRLYGEGKGDDWFDWDYDSRDLMRELTKPDTDPKDSDSDRDKLAEIIATSDDWRAVQDAERALYAKVQADKLGAVILRAYENEVGWTHAAVITNRILNEVTDD